MAQPSLRDMTLAAIDALNTNQNARALELAYRAVAQYPQAGHLQRLAFAMASERTMIPALAAQIKKAIEITLGHNDIENQRLFPCWFYIFKTSPSFTPFWENPFDWKKIEPALQDKFLIEGVRNLNFLDWDLEQIFTRLRRDLLDHFSKGTLKTKHLPVLCALAEHCFYNEYVFETGADELDAVAQINPADPTSVAMIGCYKPLADIPFDPKMSPVVGFRSMVQTHVGNIHEERAVEFNSGSIHGNITKHVAAMYEENPYPRWSNINLPHKKIEDVEIDILLAGCGTGQMATGFASALPNCSFTAIDISRTSLAYATRMTQSYGIENIEFTHLDILQAKNLNKSFDYIECSGVLHHMEDPKAGWRVLASCLKDGGGMQIALYSAITRGGIDDVRAYIKKKGYQATPADIRKFRADIASLPDDNSLKSILRMRDFYSMSMVRDLVFHIQEASYNLLQIEAMMERLGLVFDGFKGIEHAKVAYAERFPDDRAMTNLKNWDAFEKENPDTFIGMYRIFCHKKGETVCEPVARIRQIQS